MRRWLARRKREGWSWARLSYESGQPVWRLRYWQRRLERPAASSRRRRPTFIAVELSEPARGVGSIAITTPTGYRLELTGDVGPEQLRRVVEVLERRC
ncbi:MAG: hypothetical protein ACREMV_13930 [Gemmatimonadales bacterium]